MSCWSMNQKKLEKGVLQYNQRSSWIYRFWGYKKILDIVKPDDILFFPGRYDTSKIMQNLNDFTGKIHIDFHYVTDHVIDEVDRKIDSVILSTSSEFYWVTCGGTLNGLLEHFNNYKVHQFLIKENRGGSFCYISEEDKQYESKLSENLCKWQNIIRTEPVLFQTQWRTGL